MNQKQEDDSPIESLQQKLDTPKADVSGSFERHGFHREVYDAPTGWEEKIAPKTEPLMNRMSVTKKHHQMAKWLFGAAAVFFIIALGTAAFFLTGDRNVVSADKIDIAVTGPSSVSAGEMLPLAIEIRNNNSTTLEVADLLIEYPFGTRSAENVTVELLRSRSSLGNIAPGETFATTTKAILFGEEGAESEIVVTLEYRVAGSNAIFVKERAFSIEIDDSPVALSIEAPSAVNSGDEVGLELTVRSNSTIPVKNVLVRGEYPFGFNFISSEPSAAFGEAVWSLGDIEPNGERTILVRGSIEGQDDEDRIFRFDIGVEGESSDVVELDTVFATAEHSVRIERPFLDLAITAGRQAGDVFTMGTGRALDLEIAWRNNLSGEMADGVVELFIEGDALEERRISSGTGFYDSIKNVITWDKRTNAGLTLLKPGDTGRASASIETQSASDLGGKIVNPIVDLKLVFRAVPVGARDIPEQIRSEVIKTVRVSTDASLDAAVLHDDGPLDNSGPLPPRAEQETTYTVVWEVSSSVNDVTNATVVSTLPPYVTWKGVVSPAGESVSYNQATGRVEWSIGEINAGAGYSSSERTVAFQIGLVPAVTQVGSSPTLIQEAVFSGQDAFTGVTVGDTENARSTNLTDERGFNQRDGRVDD